VRVLGDNVRELNETFWIHLTNPSANAYIGQAWGLGTILNDD
jgi:hypothetical protein